MIILLVLAFFLGGSYYLTHLSQSVRSSSLAVSNYYAREQTYYAFKSLMPIVLTNLKSIGRDYNSLSDPWAKELVFSTDIGEVRVNIYDEERFFNINTAASPKGLSIFERLLRLSGVETSYARHVLVWMGRERGSLDTDYPLKLAPLDSKEELLYMGFRKDDLLGKTAGGKFYPGLWSLTTVHSNGKININTASVYVLMALDERIDETLAGKIVQRREREPFRRVEDLVLVEGFTFDMLYRIRDAVDVKSSNFHVVMDFRVGDITLTYEFIYNRDTDEVVYIKLP